jgi:hypothetical protein
LVIWDRPCHRSAGVVDMKRRAVAVLLLSAALLTTLGWTGESWGQAKIPRVGIFSFGQGLTGDQAKQWLEPFRRMLAD